MNCIQCEIHLFLRQLLTVEKQDEITIIVQLKEFRGSRLAQAVSLAPIAKHDIAISQLSGKDEAAQAWLQLRLDAPGFFILKDTAVAHVVILYSSIGIMITGLVIYGLTRFSSLISDLHATRTELAHLAVEHERATFARDLNNLLGQSLSEIVLRGELAHRLLLQVPARAGAELERILDIARRALADVRAIANRYRPLSLDQEAQLVVAMLDVADMKVQVDIDTRGLSAAAETKDLTERVAALAGQLT
jgi:signal transduction histidine kinase